MAGIKSATRSTSKTHCLLWPIPCFCSQGLSSLPQSSCSLVNYLKHLQTVLGPPLNLMVQHTITIAN